MIDTREIQTKELYEELLRGLAERLPNVIASEAEKRIRDERKEAERNTFADINKTLEAFSNWCGVVSDQNWETHDDRIAARHARALQARDFLNAYDNIAKGRPVENSNFDVRLMKIIVLAVRTYAAFEKARPDIMGHLIITPMPIQTPAPVATTDELILTAMPAHADK